MNPIVEFFLDLFYYSYVQPNPAQRLGLLVLVLVAVLIFLFAQRSAHARPPELRDLSAVEGLEAALGDTALVGAKLHVAVGIGGLADARSVETLVGVKVYSQLSTKAAAIGVPVISSTGNPTTMLALENAARATFDETGNAALLRPDSTRFVSPEPVAYAAGVMRTLNSEEVTTNVMIGSFGDEYLLMGETAALRGIDLIVGTTNPFVLPFAYATTKNLLVGEEMFALPAYLERRPSQIAGVVVQDWLRLAVVVGIGALAVGSVFGFVVS